VKGSQVQVDIPPPPSIRLICTHRKIGDLRGYPDTVTNPPGGGGSGRSVEREEVGGGDQWHPVVRFYCAPQPHSAPTPSSPNFNQHSPTPYGALVP